MGGRGAGGSTSGEWVRRRVGAGRGAGKCFIRRRSAAGREKIVIKFGSRHDFLCFGICFCVPYAAYEVGTDIDKGTNRNVPSVKVHKSWAPVRFLSSANNTIHLDPSQSICQSICKNAQVVGARAIFQQREQHNPSRSITIHPPIHR